MGRQVATDANEWAHRGGLGGRLEKAWRRLLSSNDELADEDLQQAAEDAGAQPIQQCKDRDKVTLSGTVAKVTQAPKQDEPNLSVELRDGSGAVRLTWIGRRAIPGVECGRTLRVHGRVSCQDGQRTMYNPRYELLDGE